MSKFSLLNELSGNTIKAPNKQAALQHADGSDAGTYDTIDKASAAKDIDFKSTRNSINADGNVSGSDVADYLERAAEINDEVDTIAFGLETDDGHIVKVYVNAEQADGFEEALSNLLGVDSDIEDSLNTLAQEYDIVDIVWPEGSDETPDGVEAGVDPKAPKTDDDRVGAALAGVPPDEDGVDDDDDFEVVAALPQAGLDKPEDGVDGDQELTADDLPDVPDGEEGAQPDGIASPWEQLTDQILQTFPDDDSVVSLRDLNREQLSQVIDLEKADEIAAKQYDAADFMSLDEDEQKDIINANPDLIQGDSTEEPDAVDGENVGVDDDTIETGDEATTESRKFKSLGFLSSLM